MCPVCSHSKSKPRYELGESSLLTCLECQVVYFHPMPTLDEIDSFYNNDYHRSFSQSAMAGHDFAQKRYESLLEVLKRRVSGIVRKKERSLLDVGCGTGDFLKVAQQSGWTVTGSEVAVDAVEMAKVKVGDCVLSGDISSVELSPGSYDLITSYHVVEHLLDPVAQLNYYRQLLNEEGALFIETPNIGSVGSLIRGSQWSHIIPPEHIIYFSPKSLKAALMKAGFRKVVVFTSAPHIIESTQHWPTALQTAASVVYSLASKVNMGAALQAIALKS